MQGEKSDLMQQTLARLEKAINRLEVTTSRKLSGMANLKAQELDTTLLNADRQALAEALDAEKASRELGEKLRAEALEKVDGAIELVKSVIYEAEKGTKGA